MKNNKKIVWLSVVLVVLVVAWMLIENSKNDQSSIKVGADLALTGNLAYIGVAEMNGLILANEEINKSGGLLGRKLEVVVEDNQGDPKVAVTGMEKLLSLGNPDFVFTAFTSVTQAVKARVAESGKLLIYASTVREIAQENNNFFVDYYDGQTHGTALAKEFSKSGFKKYNLLVEKSDSCNVVAKAFTDEATVFGISENKSETFDPANKDFRTALLKLKSGDYPIVMCTWRSEDLVMKQMKELNMINTPTYHFIAPFLPNSTTPETLSLFAENKTVSTWYGIDMNKTETNQKLKAFINDYKQRFKIDATSDAAYAYDDMYALKAAVELCQNTNTECVSSKLKDVKIDGVGGVLSFNLDRASERESLIIQREGNVWKQLSM